MVNQIAGIGWLMMVLATITFIAAGYLGDTALCQAHNKDCLIYGLTAVTLGLASVVWFCFGCNLRNRKA